METVGTVKLRLCSNSVMPAQTCPMLCPVDWTQTLMMRRWPSQHTLWPWACAASPATGSINSPMFLTVSFPMAHRALGTSLMINKPALLFQRHFNKLRRMAAYPVSSARWWCQTAVCWMCTSSATMGRMSSGALGAVWRPKSGWTWRATGGATVRGEVPGHTSAQRAIRCFSARMHVVPTSRSINGGSEHGRSLTQCCYSALPARNGASLWQSLSCTSAVIAQEEGSNVHTVISLVGVLLPIMWNMLTVRLGTTV